MQKNQEDGGKNCHTFIQSTTLFVLLLRDIIIMFQLVTLTCSLLISITDFDNIKT